MSAAVKNARDSGKRKSARHAGKSLLAPTLGVHETLGESRLNTQQIYALEAMFSSHPAVQAAKTVLHSQLLSGGLQLVRGASVLKPVSYGEKNDDGSRRQGVTTDWAQHLEDYWLPFARDTVDSFLKFGLATVVFAEIPDDSNQAAIERLKKDVGMAARDVKRPRTRVLVPHVPHLGTYDVAFKGVDDYGYTRQYLVYNTAPGHATRVDEAAVVHVRQHPDSVGNVNSPLATVYELVPRAARTIGPSPASTHPA